MNDALDTRKAWRLVLLVCLAQTLAQIGAFFWPALLPQLAPQWALSNSAAGWITASFYGAYMLAVPVLVTLTDRIDPKRIYLLGVGLTIVGHLLFGLFADGFWTALGCRALTGIGWAGTYMTGLKLLADRVDAKMLSRHGRACRKHRDFGCAVIRDRRLAVAARPAQHHQLRCHRRR